MASRHTHDSSKYTGRRRFLRTVGVAGAASVAGCLGESDDPSTEGPSTAEPAPETQSPPVESPVVYDPYAQVEWDSVEHHKSQFHAHFGKIPEGEHPQYGQLEGTPAEVVDIYTDRGYTVFSNSPKWTRDPNPFPWTEFSDIDEHYENRDPEELGVVAFPGSEFTASDHVEAIFTTANKAAVEEAGLSPDDRLSQVEAILDLEDHHVPEENGGMAVLGHPARYYENPDENWERYVEDFETITREEGLLGIEAFNVADWRDGTYERTDIRLWDLLLTELAPDRLLWGFGVDDPVDFQLGKRLDVRWTTVLLEESEFDPSDQAGSRSAAAAAYRDGRTLGHERPQWDPESEEPAPVPQVTAMELTAEGITIETSETDRVEWVSDAEVVATGESLSFDTDLGGYLRAHLSNEAGSAASTQPFGLEG